jgi:flavin reductase (DIM6/NTAB) family NADH-FMN oxidoreductase RutF
MIIDATQLQGFEVYPWLVGGVVPRPIAWISTRSAQGVDNLAPYSFFSVASCQPPVLSFTQIMGQSGYDKDTLRNLIQTGECVVNSVTPELLEAMNLTSLALTPEQSEFSFAQIQTTDSLWVKAPSVAHSPVRYECTLRQVMDVGEGPGSGKLVLLDVKGIVVADGLIDCGQLNPALMEALGKLGGDFYSTTHTKHRLQRPMMPVLSN